MKSLFLLLLLPLAFLACKNASDTRDDNNDRDSIIVDVNDPNYDSDGDGIPDARENDNVDTPDENAYAEFGTTRGDNTFRLRDWRSKTNLRGLGTPNDTLSRQLTLASDTHQGSTVTEYKYDDINLLYFMPKGGNDSWLRTIEIKGGDWSTARGIKVGDSVDDLKKMYPKLAQLEDEDYMYSYQLAESMVMFGIQDDKVSRIKIEYNIP